MAESFVKSHIIPVPNRLLSVARDGRGRAVRLGFGQPIFAFHVVAGLDRHGSQGDKPGAQDNADVLAAEGAADPMPQVCPCLGDGECLHVHTFASPECLSSIPHRRIARGRIACMLGRIG